MLSGVFTSALRRKSTCRGCYSGRVKPMESAEDGRVSLKGKEEILLGVERGGADGGETVAGVGEF